MHIQEMYEDAVAVTPSDTNGLAEGSRAIYVGGAGNLAVRTLNGNTVTFMGVPVGTLLKIAVERVMATNTTATNILALY